MIRAFTFIFALVAMIATAAEDFNSWQKQMPITFSGYTPPGNETLTNFPTLVILSNTTAGAGFNYADFLSPPYGDLRFVADDTNTPLYFEVESWDTNGNSYVWVQVPELTNNLTIFAFWGRSNVSVPPCATNGAVWTEGFGGVWHFSGTNSEAGTDSTSNKNNGSVFGNVAYGASGQVGGAVSFGGASTDYIECGDGSSLSPTGQMTISLWAKTTDPKAAMVAKYNSASPYDGYLFGLGPNTSDGKPYYWTGNNFYINAPTAVDNGQWRHLALVHGGITATFYVDGRISTISSAGTRASTSTRNLRLGGDWDNRNCQGTLDEIRISSLARSSNWIWACYMNTASNNVFGAYGAPEHQGNLSVANVSAVVAFSNVMLNGFLVSTGQNANVSAYVFWGTNDAGKTWGGWTYTNRFPGWTAEGPLSTNVVPTAAGAKHYFCFYATNAFAETWAYPAGIFFWLGPPTVNNAGGATNITWTGATLQGEVTGCNPTPNVWIYWGSMDQGTNKLLWDNAIPIGPASNLIFSANVSLTPGQPHYYCCYASNTYGEAWSPVVNFGETLNTWQKEMLVTFTGYAPPGGGTLTNFPALVILSNTTAGVGFNYNDFLSPPYGELRFAAADKTTPLNFEVEKWDTNGKSYVWVQVPALAGTNTQIWAFWGKGGVTAPPCTTNGAVWSENFSGVWHLTETNGVTSDSSSNRYPASITGAGVQGAPGQVAGAYRFSGSSSYVTLAITNGTTVTISAWAMSALASPAQDMIWCRATYNPDLWFTGGNIYLNAGDGTGNPFCAQPASVTQLHHYVTVIDATQAKARLYIDGQLASASANYKNPSGTPLKISSGCGYDWNGVIDEFTVASVPRSTNWIWASYMNMASNETFNTYDPPAFRRCNGTIIYAW